MVQPVAMLVLSGTAGSTGASGSAADTSGILLVISILLIATNYGIYC